MLSIGPRRRFAKAFADIPTNNPWLDCLRTIAVALVLMRHGQRALDNGPPQTILETLMLNGWVGVDLFFVLSGYLVSAGLLRSYASNSSFEIGNYSKRRAWRILPAYLFVLFLVIVGYFPGFAVPSENLVFSTLYHLVFLQDVLPSDITVVYWSLGVEAKFYLAAPLFVALALRGSPWLIFLCIGLVSIILAPAIRGVIFETFQTTDYPSFWQSVRSPFYACIEPFALGLLIALCEHKKIIRIPVILAIALFCCTLLGLSAYLMSHVFLARIGIWDATFQPTTITVIFCVLVVSAIAIKDVRLPFADFFQFGARVSYSLYLVHFPLIPLSTALSNANGTGPIGFWLTYVALSLIHAIIIYAYIEEPFIKGRKPEQTRAPIKSDPMA